MHWNVHVFCSCMLAYLQRKKHYSSNTNSQGRGCARLSISLLRCKADKFTWHVLLSFYQKKVASVFRKNNAAQIKSCNECLTTNITRFSPLKAVSHNVSSSLQKHILRQRKIDRQEGGIMMNNPHFRHFSSWLTNSSFKYILVSKRIHLENR